MLIKSLIMTAILKAVQAKRQHSIRRKLSEITTTADYKSYFDLANLVGGGWTDTVSPTKFTNNATNIRRTPLPPSIIPSLCISTQNVSPQLCTRKLPITDELASDVVFPSNLSFESYLSSVSVDIETSEDKFYISTSIFNFKSMWDNTGAVSANAQIGHNSGDKDEYVYFAPWDNSITSITYKIILTSHGKYTDLRQFKFTSSSGRTGTAGCVICDTSQTQNQYTYTPTGKIIGISGSHEDTDSGKTCGVNFTYNLCSCYSSFYQLSDNAIQTVYTEIGVAAQKAFTISDGVTDVFSGQKCGTFLTSAVSVTPNAAFLAAVTPTTGNTSSVTISTSDYQFMGTTQTVKLQVMNSGFTAKDNSGTYYLPTLMFNMDIVMLCRVYPQTPQITDNGILTFNYFIFSGTAITPAFLSLQKMNNDQTKFCTYDLTYTSAVSPNASDLTLTIDKVALTVSLSSSNQWIKDTSQTVTVTSSLNSADNANYVAAGWTYPNNGLNFIVNIKCSVVAFTFTFIPLDITSTELRPDVTSAIFAAEETPSSTSCGYLVIYAYSTLPSWVNYDSGTQTFKIVSSTVTPTGVDRTATITMTATLTVPAGYVGIPPIAQTSITAILLACSVDSVQPVTTPQLNLAYTLNDASIAPATVSSQSFSYSQTPACLQPISVSITNPIVSPLSSISVATLQGTSPYQLAISTNNFADIGIHTIVVSANVNLSKRTAIYTTTDFNFLLSVTCSPIFNFVTIPADITSIELQTDVTSASFVTTNATSCGYTVTYAYSALPSWVKYDSGTQTFKIVSSTVTPTGADRTATITMTASLTVPAGYVGIPPIASKITATLLSNPDQTKVQTSSNSSNKPPYFTEPNDWPYFLVLTCGKSWKYKIPPISDEDQNDFGKLKPITLGQAASFMTFDDQKQEFNVEAGFIAAKLNGEYKITATLKDLNGGESKYVIEVTVICNDFNANKKNVTVYSPFKSSEKPPMPFIIRISGTGRVSVKFNEELVVVNSTNITNGTVIIEDIERPLLEVKVFPFEKHKVVSFTWECLNFTALGMELQLYFEKPNRVSYEIPLDNLHLTFWGQPAFKAYTRMDYVPYAYNLTYPIPAQLDPASGAMLDSVLTHASLEQKMSMFGSFFVQVLVSGSIQPILDMIKKSQIIAHMTLVNISIPASSSIYFSFMFSIISFSLLPTSEYFDKWFQLPQQDPVTPNFGALGYETTFFLRNLGQVSFYLLLWPLQIACAYILGKIKHKKAIKLSRSWKKSLIWRGILSYIEGQTVLISVSFLLAVVYQTKEDWTNPGQTANIVMAILVGGAVMVYPFFQLIKMHKLFPKIRNENGFIKQRWGQMFESLHIPKLSSKLNHFNDGKSTIYYPFYCRLRQIGMAVCLCTLISQPMLCIFYFNFAALFAIILAGIIRPFSLPSENTSEMLNEFGILVLNYHLLCLTDFVFDPDTREAIGLSMCGTTSLILLCNILVIVVDLFSKWCKRFKWWLKKRQLIKLKAEKQAMLLLQNEQKVNQQIEDYKRMRYGKKLESPYNKKKQLELKRNTNATLSNRSQVFKEKLEVISEEESVQSSVHRSPRAVYNAEQQFSESSVDKRPQTVNQDESISRQYDFSIKNEASNIELPSTSQLQPKLVQLKQRVMPSLSQLILQQRRKLKPIDWIEPKMTSYQSSQMLWLEHRIKNMKRGTQEEEENYWAERQKLSVIKAQQSTGLPQT